MTDTCGYTVIDLDGNEQPCDRPAPEWRWYQDTGHEDCLEPACSWHANEGGRRMHAALALVDEWECPPHYRKNDAEVRAHGWLVHVDFCHGCMKAAQLRAAIKGEA